MSGTSGRSPVRCPWTGIEHEDYARYHDTEWGVPLTDDRRLFEKIVLEGFQSGLSWLTILKKRDNFRRAFHDFDAARMARYGDRDVARLMADAGIVRHRQKIEAAIDNAKAFAALSRHTSFAQFVWSFAPPPADTVPSTMKDIASETDASRALSKALKKEGFRFVGPVTVHAFMQSSGMVNDHLACCHRRAACERLQRAHRKTLGHSTPR